MTPSPSHATLLVAKTHVTPKKIEHACAFGSPYRGSWERFKTWRTMVRNDEGRYKEYMRHHNPYKFKPARLAARRRSGRINSLKADKNLCPTISQSGNNDQEFDDRGMCDNSIFICDVNSSESSGEQMHDTLETTDSQFRGDT